MAEVLVPVLILCLLMFSPVYQHPSVIMGSGLMRDCGIYIEVDWLVYCCTVRYRVGRTHFEVYKNVHLYVVLIPHGFTYEKTTCSGIYGPL